MLNNLKQLMLFYETYDVYLLYGNFELLFHRKHFNVEYKKMFVFYTLKQFYEFCHKIAAEWNFE